MTAARSPRAIPVNLDIMGGPAAGDDVTAAIAVEVGGQGILAGHAAVVDGDAIEDGRICSRPGIEDEDARPARTERRRAVRVALADDQLVVLVSIQVGAPKWQMADEKWQMANGGWQMTDDGKWQMANGRRPESCRTLSWIMFHLPCSPLYHDVPEGVDGSHPIADCRGDHGR